MRISFEDSVALLLILGALGCPVAQPPAPRAWQTVAADEPEAYTSVAGTSDDDVWVVGADVGAGATALHFDGTGWVRHQTGHRATLWWVQPFSDGTAFFGGSSSTILRFDGTSFVRQQTPGLARHTIFGLWGRAPDDLYAVGSVGGRNGFVWRYDGQRWRELDVAASLPFDRNGDGPGLFKVWGPPSGKEVWVVGARGVVLHSDDGERFERVETSTTASLFTVHGTSDRVSIVGGGGTGGALLEGNRASLMAMAPADAPSSRASCSRSAEASPLVRPASSLNESMAPGNKSRRAFASLRSLCTQSGFHRPAPCGR